MGDPELRDPRGIRRLHCRPRVARATESIVSMITSLSNPLVARVRRLQDNARRRQKEQAFFAEGVLIVSTAIGIRASIEALLYADELVIDAEGRAALGRQPA